PQRTVAVGSGLLGLSLELSKWAVQTTFDPAGIRFGSARTYLICQAKSYRGTESTTSDLPSGYSTRYSKALPRRCMCRMKLRIPVSLLYVAEETALCLASPGGMFSWRCRMLAVCVRCLGGSLQKISPTEERSFCSVPFGV